MTCLEARKLLYDVQTSRTSDSPDERKSLLLLARAHLQVCVACNEFFEHEREFVRVLHDRITHLADPVPDRLLVNVLTNVHQARVKEMSDTTSERSSLKDKLSQYFRKRK